MAKAKTKVVTLEGTTALSNEALARAIAGLFANAFPPVDFALTQKPRVQVAQAPKAKAEKKLPDNTNVWDVY